jgi:hypothetical protein
MSAAIRRSSAAIGGHKPFMLSKASLISGAVSQLEPGYVHVALTAEMQGTRSAVAGGMTAMVTIGGAAVTILAVLSPLWWLPLLPIPAFLGAGYAIKRGYPTAVERVRLGLERALDHLEREDLRAVNALPGGGVAGLLGDVVRAITGDRPK